MRNKTLLLTTILLAAPLVASADPIFFDDDGEFDAANPGLTLIDFEGLVDSGTTPYDSSMTPGATLNFTRPRIVDSSTCGAASDHFAANVFGNSGSIQFSPTVNAVGFNIGLDADSGCGDGGVDGDVTISLFSGMALLDTQTFSTTTIDTFTTFAGWSGLGQIDNVTITVNSNRDFLNLDNLRYGRVSVSEPDLMVLLGLGLLVLAVALRRRRTG